jgi:hypothetical protein
MRDRNGGLRRRGDEALAAYRNDWYAHSEANADRYDALVNILQQQGSFALNEAMVAFWPNTLKSLEIKERVALWLRTELGKLRKGGRKGEAPVRRRKVLSKLVIADIAITMLESGGLCAPGGNLLQLLEELLDVDRHRATLAQDPIYSDQFINAADMEADARLQGKTYSARELARIVKVAPETIITWRKSDAYKRRRDFWL